MTLTAALRDVRILSVLVALTAACNDNNTTTTDAGRVDSGVDAGTTDGGHVDGGTTDGGTTDGGTTDGGFIAAVTETDLVSDQTGAAHQDANLVNAWGIAASPTGPWWVSDNGSGLSTVYDSNGVAQSLVVTIPPPPSAAVGTTAAPTGLFYNGSADFNGDTFIFATEDGTIAGWQNGTAAAIRVDNSASGAVYKGIAIGGSTLYAANFHAGTIDKFDANYTAQGSFTDTTLPSGFAPFNIATLNGHLYVTFAKQDANAHDDVAGPGNGFIDVFDLTGGNQQRLVSNGPLDSPWGMALAPATFGNASNMLLVGNFGGDNFINVFDPTSGAHHGHLTKQGGGDLAIEGLWGLHFGNGGNAGPTNALFFTAGPGGEAHGLFGKLAIQ